MDLHLFRESRFFDDERVSLKEESMKYLPDIRERFSVPVGAADLYRFLHQRILAADDDAVTVPVAELAESVNQSVISVRRHLRLLGELEVIRVTAQHSEQGKQLPNALSLGPAAVEAVDGGAPLGTCPESEVEAWEQAVKDSRTTIQWLEARNTKLKQRVRVLENRLKVCGYEIPA